MDVEKLALVEPTVDLKDAFLAMAAEFYAEGEGYSHHETARDNFGNFVAKLEAARRGKGMAAGRVPMTSFWLLKGGVLLGESRLRHYLTAHLRVEGGHIGYTIRPSARRKGYGTAILSLTLEKAWAMGLERVLVTCDTDNIASVRVIEKNGGVLTGTAISPSSGKRVSQYWIDVEPATNRDR